MISREELARELKQAWTDSIGQPDNWWLRVADRALELLKGEKP
jgi:hypothetical protein